MCDPSESNYLDGEVVWVKLGSYWWPGQIIDPDKLPPDVLPSFRKPPIAVVKFFQEDTYEYVKNPNAIYKYNCSRKEEFIQKGLDIYRTKHGPMDKFPEDVIRAETATNGDLEILTRDEFQEKKKESYAGLFGGSAKKSPGSVKKGKGGKSTSPSVCATPAKKVNTEKRDYKVYILVQDKKTNITDSPSTSYESSEASQPMSPCVEKSVSVVSTPCTPSGSYSCHACSFTTTRLNVMILHNKTHSVTFTPYTPTSIKKKPATKQILKSTSKTSKTPNVRRPRKEKTLTEKEKKKDKSPAHKRSAEVLEAFSEAKKPKTDQEIKSSLLADWDDGDEESNDESMVTPGSPEVPKASDSAMVPAPNEESNMKMSVELSNDSKNSDDSPPQEKQEDANDSRYEFCEDEDWPLEADVGRKIPRVKNPSKRKENTKSLSLDENDVAREVAELLSKTTVPELPSVPESLKVEENFPEPSVVKSPDKTPSIPSQSNISFEHNINEGPTNKPAIFKTKTFFRSRHSRSQDVIGKYVAEQLNAAERLDMSENEMNGSEIASSPEARDSPPLEQLKVAKLAPKIQLKKMKAEAAQLKEKERLDQIDQNISVSTWTDLKTDKTETLYDTSNINKSGLPIKHTQDVLYPTQEIKPINKENDVISHESLMDKNNCANQNQSYSQSKNKKEEDFVPEVMIETEEVINKTEELTIETQEVINNREELINSTENEKFDVKECINDDSQKTCQLITKACMTESTASAVDALLSVSRESDRVTKNISDDPPEDLFEDDNKDNSIINNGFVEAKDNFCEKVPNNLQEVSEVPLNENILKQKMTCEDVQEEPTQDVLCEKIGLNDYKTDNKDISENVPKSMPSESDLQIAEALINLPSTAIKSINCELKEKHLNIPKGLDNEPIPAEFSNFPEIVHLDSCRIDHSLDVNKKSNINTDTPTIMHKDLNDECLNVRYESEQEKSENLNAAQSLVQMSKSIEPNINITESNTQNVNDSLSNSLCTNQDSDIDSNINRVEQKLGLLSSGNAQETSKEQNPKFDITSSKLLKILEEPCASKAPLNKIVTTNQICIPGKEKILNFDVDKTSKNKPQLPKQKIIIRRTTAGKSFINFNDSTSDKIILSRNNLPNSDGNCIESYTMKTSSDSPSDGSTIIIQQKIRKIVKAPAKIQKIKNPGSLISNLKEMKTANESTTSDDTLFDINSMPVVLSDDILTPENIEKMPIVMSDGSLVTNPTIVPMTVKTKPVSIENEKNNSFVSNKPLKTVVLDTKSEVNKVTTPNILSKSSKLRGTKPMLVIDKTIGKQKFVMTKSDPVKDINSVQTIIQPVSQNTAKTEKFIIVPTANSPRSVRTQKIVIDPQTGKTHVLVAKGAETVLNVTDNKSVPTKLLPSPTEITGNNQHSNTVMIITNAQGAQSRIVLTPEHEKILFPNKQQNVPQLKTVTHRITTNTEVPQKVLVTTVAPTKTLTPIKTFEPAKSKLVPKQKSAIITSKGQLIVGGRVATTAQNIAPMPEIRPALKRIITTDPKKSIQNIQKNTSEPLILLQQKSGAVMQLTTAQFEHLQKTGQIVHKSPALIQDSKILGHKSITIPSNDQIVTNVTKQKARKVIESPTPVKRLKQEIVIGPVPSPPPVPALASLSNTVVTSIVPPLTNKVTVTATTTYPQLDNFEELLPSTAIVRPTDTHEVKPLTPPEQILAAPQAPLSDGQLLAVPGEHFGGPTGSFYLCVEDNGTLTPIDNRPLVLENNQLVPMPLESLSMLAPQPERRDILEAALANSDVFHGEPSRDDAPDFRDLNANVSVHCRVSETSTTLNQPIMTPVEMPTKADTEPTVPCNLEDGLAVIGVTPHTVPTSLELPITVTDPRIAPKTTDPLSGTNYGAPLLPSPSREMTFVASEEVESSVVGSMSMPLLLEESVGKSMPLLTDEVTDRTMSSVDSTVGSPSSIEVRESENEDGVQWSRRLLTPCSDTSENSTEIPLQPAIQLLSINDLSRNS